MDHIHHCIRIMKMDSSPDTKLAKKIYDYYSAENVDFSKTFHRFDGKIYGSGCDKNKDFVREIQSKFHAEKIRDDIEISDSEAETLSESDYISFGVLDNGDGGTDTINETWQELIFAIMDISENEYLFKEKSNNKIYDVHGKPFTILIKDTDSPYKAISSKKEISLGIDDDGNLIACNLNNRRLVDKEGSYVNNPNHLFNLQEEFLLEETGEAVYKVFGCLKISNFKEDPSNKDALQKIQEQIGGTVNLEEGTLKFEIEEIGIKLFFTRILQNTNFKCDIDTSIGIYEFSKGKCLFCYEY